MEALVEVDVAHIREALVYVRGDRSKNSLCMLDLMYVECMSFAEALLYSKANRSNS